MSEMALSDGNGNRLAPTGTPMVIECHMRRSDSVILAWHEPDECKVISQTNSWPSRQLLR